MALTVSSIAQSVFGNKRVVLANVAFDDSYTTGGLALSPASVGLSSIDAVILNPAMTASGTTGKTCAYKRSTGKVLAYNSVTTAADAEVDNASDQSTFSFDCFIVGI